MLRATRKRISVAGGPALFVLMFGGFFTGCSDPQRPAPEPAADFAARWDNGTLEFRLDGSPGASTDLTLVATHLQFDDSTEVLHAGVALHNAGGHAVTGPASVVVFGFIPEAVTLLDVPCGAPLAPGECAIDYTGAYGTDGILSPGETSTPVAWRLHVPAGQSFAFRARLGAFAGGPGSISGVVFADTDRDGRRDAGESGIRDVTVRLRGPAGSHDVRTDTAGHYQFQVDEPGIYDVSADLSAHQRPTTVQPLRVTLLRQADGSIGAFTQGDLGVATPVPGPTLLSEGFAYADLDRDGQRDAAEPGIAGVKIRGRACDTPGKTADDDDDDDGHEVETWTDATGYYRLVLPDCGGPWEIRGGSVENSDRTTPEEVVFTAPPAPGTALHADFGYAPEDASSRFEVRGVVFRDDDGDGLRDPAEPALYGVLVTARGIACAGPALAADYTDERGRYKLEGQDIACPLPWVVQRAAIAGSLATTPASVQLDAPPLFSREFTVDFGVKLQP